MRRDGKLTGAERRRLLFDQHMAAANTPAKQMSAAFGYLLSVHQVTRRRSNDWGRLDQMTDEVVEILLDRVARFEAFASREGSAERSRAACR